MKDIANTILQIKAGGHHARNGMNGIYLSRQ
jgi:hypothetical protein